VNTRAGSRKPFALERIPSRLSVELMTADGIPTPNEQVTGILPTRHLIDSPQVPRAFVDFSTPISQAIDDQAEGKCGGMTVTSEIILLPMSVPQTLTRLITERRHASFDSRLPD
jgi:hypothetical protein